MMKINALSAAFTTNKIKETREFYIRHFNARVTFDCGWYVNLEFGSPARSLQFMAPQKPAHKPGTGQGLVYNFEVKDVDQVYKDLTGAGLSAVESLEDHPWGDRGFAIEDPNGIRLYIYSPREPDDTFRQYYR